MTKTTKIVNFLGGPCLGKSTVAAKLFTFFKENHFESELVTEYAKDLVWDEAPMSAFANQLFLFAEQNRRLERLRGKVEYVVTDTSLLLGLAYARKDYYKHLTPLILEVFNSYDNLNVFIERSTDYNAFGRNQNSAQAIEKDFEIRAVLDDNNIEYVIERLDSQTAERTFERLFK